jgi:hypothetical protein
MDDELRIAVNLNTPSTVDITGQKGYIVQTAQILAWAGAAIQVSDTAEVQYSETLIIPAGRGSFLIEFVQKPLVDVERTCWLPMFYNPVVAKGWPIPWRENHELGLEMPLEMMAMLIGAENAVEYGSGLILKGFSSMLVPVALQNKSVQWHLVSNMDGRRMRYSEVRARCPKRLSMDEFNKDSLLSTRAFLAWSPSSESYLGTRTVQYEHVAQTEASLSSRAVKMTDISVGFQNWGAGSVSFSVGLKDRPRRISRASRLEMTLNAADQMHVCLYDFASKRAWLVSGTETLLHLIHLKHMKRPYCSRGVTLQLSYADPAFDGATASRTALMEMASTPIFSDKSISVDDYCVKDLIRELWLRLEVLEGDDEESGITVGMGFGGKLKGYEMMDLVTDKGVLRQRETKLKKTNGGWLDLVKACDGVVLFGSQFGDLIKPTSCMKALCASWTNLPPSKDYLATTVHKLLQIFGQEDEQGHLSLFGLRIHKASLLFEDCPSQSSKTCRCERLQQIISKSLFSIQAFRTVVPPGPLTEMGCLIIGRACKKLRQSNSSLKEQVSSILDTDPSQNEENVLVSTSSQMSTKGFGKQKAQDSYNSGASPNIQPIHTCAARRIQ